jgi:hypothetical protein
VRRRSQQAAGAPSRARAAAADFSVSRWRRGGRRFIAFRYHDVGKKGGVERVAGQRPDRTWDTAGWLLSKDLAHVERGRLVPDTVDARKVLSALGATPRHVGGDRFQAKDRPNLSERAKANPTKRRGPQRNIRNVAVGKGSRH